MNHSPAQSLVAVDIGNTRLKLGLFPGAETADTRGALPVPDSTLEVSIDRMDDIAGWLSPRSVPEVSWWIGSVQRGFTTELLDWLRGQRADLAITLLCSDDLDLLVDLPRPDKVGIDRLLAAVAVNRVRGAGREAVIVDLGTATTVDLVSPSGAFRGGAIMPGVAMAARAMHEFTDLLPWLDMTRLEAPPPEVGGDTLSAMRSGLFWGAVGGTRELITRMTSHDSPPQVFLTGGAAESVAPLLAIDTQFAPNLTLGGIALTAWRMLRGD